MKTKERNNQIIEEDLDFEDLDAEDTEEVVHEEEVENHSKLSMIFHLFMAIAAIIIVVVIVAVMMLKNSPVTYNDIDSTGIEVSGVYQSILEWEAGTGGAEHYVEDKVSVTVLTQDSEVPAVLLEGVLTEMHGMSICFSEDSERGYYAACFTSGNTTYLLESEEITKKQFTKAVEQFVVDQY